MKLVMFVDEREVERGKIWCVTIYNEGKLMVPSGRQRQCQLKVILEQRRYSEEM